ncbi:MAG: 4Fe-4S dicluster domain-containing protein [Candidatus Bathyarchaeia archaeon]
MGRKIMIIDVAKCVGCYACQIACKDEHVDNDWTPYAKPQPDTGSFWRRVEEMERGSFPKVKLTYIPVNCMHCDNPPCIRACRIGAIVKRADGATLIQPEKCNGCIDIAKPLCVNACPYNAIYFNEKLKIAQKCTLCAHLLDGKDPLYQLEVPRCVDACQKEAMMFGDEETFKQVIEKAEVLHPEYGTKPRVHYLNLPKPFIAGTVTDPINNEVVEGAKVVAANLFTGKKHETVTDEFGDFWIKNLEWNHKYVLYVEKEGYPKKTIDVVTTEKDINLGNIEI